MRFMVLCLALLVPMQAQALSCLRPSVARTYLEVDAAPQDYQVVKGRLTLDIRKLPKSHARNAPEMTRIEGRLTGKLMASGGFRLPFDQPLTLEVACLGPWCGSVENGQDIMAFIRRDAGGQYALAVGPCAGHVFANPRKAQLETALRCVQGGACED